MIKIFLVTQLMRLDLRESLHTREDSLNKRREGLYKRERSPYKREESPKLVEKCDIPKVRTATQFVINCECIFVPFFSYEV